MVLCNMDEKVGAIIKKLNPMRNEKNIAGMKRFGISSKNTLGVSVVELRKLAKTIGKNHNIAIGLWNSGIHEARILASFIEEVDKIDEKQMEKWVKDFDSWDICDQVCSNIFDKTPFAKNKVEEWTRRKEEFVKRAGFVLMAVTAVHDKKATNEVFKKWLPIIKRESKDERNYVRKAINWALRQIGKRNEYLGKKALSVAIELSSSDSKTAKWIGSDAKRELLSKLK